MYTSPKNHRSINMKFGFVTCVQIGLSCMEAIYAVKGKLDLIITIPDDKATKKSGRIYVDDFAKKNNIAIIKTNHINDTEAIAAIKEHDIDWLFIIGWSQIASKNVVDAPNKGTIGAHPTLLPIGRGRAAVPWAIIKNLDKTGVSFFKMDEGVDTGLILDQEEIPITKEETATTLYAKVNMAHETIIQKLYPVLVAGTEEAKVQDDSKATYWPGRKPEDGQILKSMTIEEVDRLVRATTRPYPGAFSMDGDKKVIIWSGSVEKPSRGSKDYPIDVANGTYYGTDFSVL